MKRRIALAAALVIAALVPLLADEEAEVYRNLYREAEGLQQKHSAIQNLVGLKDRETAPVIAEALEEMLRTQNNYTTASEKELFARALRTVAAALGEYKYEASAPFLWMVVEQVKDPLARAEALMALGRMRALAYAERISLFLRDLNLKPADDADAGEKLAYGAIIALEKLKDPRGFSPVFFAADGWYSQRVKKQAERSLPNIVADPSDILKGLIDTEDPARKVMALKFNASSSAPVERKNAVAAYALALGHLKAPRDRAEAKIFSDLRKLALRSLVAYKSKDTGIVDGALASYTKGFDDEERLLGLTCLGSNGTDPAATALRDVILQLNKEQKAGVSDEVRIRMIKAAIENAGLTKNRIVRPALVSVASNDGNSGWSSSVILAAQSAMKEIP
ncbi:MAG: hypothetical protein JNG85_08215 [Spirochaetaceae bacterium]|nr:hypothetical protein [Spirochaetaceae bacterium]